MRGEEGEGRKEGDTKQIGGREGERERGKKKNHLKN